MVPSPHKKTRRRANATAWLSREKEEGRRWERAGAKSRETSLELRIFLNRLDRDGEGKKEVIGRGWLLAWMSPANIFEVTRLTNETH